MKEIGRIYLKTTSARKDALKRLAKEAGKDMSDLIHEALDQVYPELPPDNRGKGAPRGNQNWRGSQWSLGNYDNVMFGWSDEDYARLNADVERRTHFVAWIDDDGGIQVEQRKQRPGEKSVIAVRPEPGGSHPANDVYVVLLRCDDEWFPILRDEAVRLAVEEMQRKD